MYCVRITLWCRNCGNKSLLVPVPYGQVPPGAIEAAAKHAGWIVTRIDEPMICSEDCAAAHARDVSPIGGWAYAAGNPTG